MVVKRRWILVVPQLAAEIRRLHLVEGWRRHTIANHLGVHHSTVSRVLRSAGLLAHKVHRRSSMMDRFVPFIKETFDRYPNLSASVVYEMAKKRGYPGGADNFRHRIRELSLRPRKTPEAFFALRTLSGEQAQVDWAHFGSRKVEGGVRKLSAFVMVLSYSRSVEDERRLQPNHGAGLKQVAPEEYARRAVALYIKAEGTPKRPRLADWDTARDLCNRGVELRLLEHTIRIATLRRTAGGTAEPIHSLACFRTVVLALQQDHVEQGYIDYVKEKALQKDQEKRAAKQPISSASS